MNHPYLRPMGAGEIISGAFRIFREHLALMVTVALFPHLVLLAMQSLLLAAGPPTDVTFLMFMLGTIVMNGIALGAITIAVCQVLLGWELRVFQVYALTFRANLLSVVGAYLLIALMVSTGLILFIPGLVLGGLFAPAIPIIVVERRRTFSGLARAIAMMRGEMAKGIAVFAFFILVAGLLPLLALFLQAGVAFGPFSPLLGAIIGSVTLPLGFSASVLLYLSLRAGDGLNAEQLEEELSGSLAR